jgi:hypothetical protein
MGSHQALYGSGGGGGQAHTADALGAGAAMQALKVSIEKWQLGECGVAPHSLDKC